MNEIRAIETEYITPSRTIEIILVSKGMKQRLFYFYNYEGYHFRLFDSLLDLILFFEDKESPYLEFDKEDDVDGYLERIELDYDKMPFDRCSLRMTPSKV